MRGSLSVGAGSVIVAERRSSETRTAPLVAGRGPEKSTAASTLPAATNRVRSPFTNDGIRSVSSSTSTTTWRLAVAARYSLRFSSDLSSAGWLRSTVSSSNGLRLGTSSGHEQEHGHHRDAAEDELRHGTQCRGRLLCRRDG